MAFVTSGLGTIQITLDTKDIEAWLRVAPKQIPFATAYALTRTAGDIKKEETAVIKRVFDRPTRWAVNSLYTTMATKDRLQATVEFKDGAWRYMKPHIMGGGRNTKRFEDVLFGARYAVPGSGMTLDRYGNAPGGTIARIMSHLKAASDPQQNITGSKRSKAKRKNSRYFFRTTEDGMQQNIVYERKGRSISPVLVAVTAPKYRKRFPYFETAERVYGERILPNFAIAFQRAMGTSGYKGKWKP